MCRKEKKYSLIRDVIEPHWDTYLAKHPRLHPRVIRSVDSMRICRTPALGYNEYICPDCGEIKKVNHSCKHRFCPQCGQIDTNKWAQKIAGNLLNIKHHHVIFTVPHELNQLFRFNERLLYSSLMNTASHVLINWFQHSKKCMPGIMTVLHTFGSDIKYHIHLHMLISSGGLDTDSNELKLIPNKFLVKSDFIRNKFRHEFEGVLIQYRDQGKLNFPDSMKSCYFKKFLKDMNKKNSWVVHICPEPLKDPADIVGYIGRYTRRACISEYRLEHIDINNVTFTWKDYKAIRKGDSEIIKQAVLPWETFLNRLFQHIPHKGFRMVRYYGIYNNSIIGRIPEKYHYKPGEQLNHTATDPAKSYSVCTSYMQYLLESGRKNSFVCEHCNTELMLFERHYNRNLIRFGKLKPEYINTS